MSIGKYHKLLKVKMVKKSTVVIIFWLVLFAGQVSCAQESCHTSRAALRGSGSSSMLPTLLDILLLVGTFACFLISVRVKSFLRDGDLASGWTLFSLSFVLLLVAQLLSLSLSIGLLNIPPSIISSIRVLFILFLASGVYFMKKVLS